MTIIRTHRTSAILCRTLNESSGFPIQREAQQAATVAGTATVGCCSLCTGVAHGCRNVERCIAPPLTNEVRVARIVTVPRTLARPQPPNLCPHSLPGSANKHTHRSSTQPRTGDKHVVFSQHEFHPEVVGARCTACCVVVVQFVDKSTGQPASA